MVVRRILFVLLAFVSSASAQEVLEEEWVVMNLMGVRVGHTQGTRIRHTRPGGAVEIETVAKSRLRVKRMGAGLEVSTDLKTFETPDGRPLRFHSRMVASSSPTTAEGVIENGKLRLRTVTGGVEKETVTDWDPDCLLAEGVRLLSIKKGFAEGTKYRFKMYQAELGKADEVDIEIGGRESKAVLGKERTLARVITKSKLQPAIVITSWVDEQGATWVSEMSMSGLKFQFERSTKEEALKEAPAEMPEIFFGTMPRSNLALPRPREVTSLTLRLERPDETLAEWKPPEETQKVLEREKGAVKLRIVSAPPKEPATLPIKGHEEYLKPSPGVQCDDADIVKSAREIVGDEKDSLKAARKLAGWVHQHIDKKSMDIAAASAKEVFTNRSGDCSEHAVLLAAMLRAAGIPAKVCIGYLYFRGAWGGHAWAAAWVGSWIDLDATLGDGIADAARIKFSETTPDDAGAMMEGATGAGFMHGKMKIEILEYSLDGRAHSVGRPGTTSNDRFSAPLLGVSFQRPADWTFKSPDDLPPFTLAVLASPDGKAEVLVSYIDLPYEAVKLDTKKAARKLGAGSSGELGKIAGFETYETESKLFVRLSPGEMLEFLLKDSEAARPALARIKETLKIAR
jgi:hypothetical protein